VMVSDRSHRAERVEKIPERAEFDNENSFLGHERP